MLTSKGRRDREDDVKHSLPIGPSRMAHFYSSTIHKRKRFRILARNFDMKTIFDSRILEYFDVGMEEKTPFYGVLTNIVYLQYGKCDQTLFNDMWYDNNGTHSKRSTTIVIDKCKITCIKAIPMPYQDKVTFDPFHIIEWT